jgi:hypothetical protein
LALTAAALSDLPDPQWVMANCDGVEYFATTPVPADTSAVIGLGHARLWFNAGASAPLVPEESVIWYQQQVEIIGGPRAHLGVAEPRLDVVAKWADPSGKHRLAGR